MDQARAILRRHFGYDDCRPAQAPVIQSILAGTDTLAVLPTGATYRPARFSDVLSFLASTPATRRYPSTFRPSWAPERSMRLD